MILVQQNTPAPISDADATNVMSYAQSFEPTLKSILKTAVDKKLDMLSLNFSNVSGFMKQGLTEFNRTTCTFGDALIGLFSVRSFLLRQFHQDMLKGLLSDG